MNRLGPAQASVTSAGLAVPVALLMIAVCVGGWSSSLLGPAAATAATARTTARAGATAAPTPVAPTQADPVALRLLARASAAPAMTPYRGLQFVSTWSSAGSTGLVVQVDHRPGLGTSVRSAGTAVAPGGDTYLVAGAAEPSIMGGAALLGLLADTYDVVASGNERVAGRDCFVVTARRPKTGSPAARFCIDEVSGLVLRREVYDERGRLTRASAFVQVDVGRATATARARPDRQSTGSETKPTGPDRKPAGSPAIPDAWSQRVVAAALVPMRHNGWTCPSRLPGSLRLVDARRTGRDAATILQLGYSDGLASVSLFQQPGWLDGGDLDGYRRTVVAGHPAYVHDGVLERVIWSASGMVFTLVADAPAGTVEQIVAALPHPAPDHGIWTRLGRGADRVGSWFNPFQ